jgi:hypothetical protein
MVVDPAGEHGRFHCRTPRLWQRFHPVLQVHACCGSCAFGVPLAESLLQSGSYAERGDAGWGAQVAPYDFDFGTNDLRQLARTCKVQFSDLELEPLGAVLNAEARAQAP